MGIDYNSKLVVGVEITFEQAKKIVEKYDLCPKEDIEEYLWEEVTFPQYPRLSIVHASAYYDCSIEHCKFFVNIDTGDVRKFDDMLVTLQTWKESGIFELLTDVFDSTFNLSPTVFSLSHVY